MSNYTQNTSFTAKDALTTGDPAKIIRGSDFDAEFGEIETTIATKEDTANKGAANGYVPLDASTLISLTYFPTVTPAKGGTGATSLTADSVILGNGASAVKEVALGAANTVLRSTGAAWEAAALVAADIPALDAAKITTGEFDVARIPVLTNDELPTVGVAKGGTGRTTLAVGSYLSGNGTSAVSLSDAATVMNDIGAERTVTAGNGLTGGGTLAADRTITLGTPGTLGPATTNAATTDSHTHAIGAGIVKAHDATGGQVFMSEADPTGGADGDIWFKVAPL